MALLLRVPTNDVLEHVDPLLLELLLFIVYMYIVRGYTQCLCCGCVYKKVV